MIKIIVGLVTVSLHVGCKLKVDSKATTKNVSCTHEDLDILQSQLDSELTKSGGSVFELTDAKAKELAAKYSNNNQFKSSVLTTNILEKAPYLPWLDDLLAVCAEYSVFTANKECARLKNCTGNTTEPYIVYRKEAYTKCSDDLHGYVNSKTDPQGAQSPGAQTQDSGPSTTPPDLKPSPGPQINNVDILKQKIADCRRSLGKTQKPSHKPHNSENKKAAFTEACEREVGAAMSTDLTCYCPTGRQIRFTEEFEIPLCAVAAEQPSAPGPIVNSPAPPTLP